MRVHMGYCYTTSKYSELVVYYSCMAIRLGIIPHPLQSLTYASIAENSNTSYLLLCTILSVVLSCFKSHMSFISCKLGPSGRLAHMLRWHFV